MSTALKPCPFCGGEAEFERLGTPRQSCIVACRNCGARHESSDEDERSGEQWNGRAASPQPAAQPEVAFHCGDTGIYGPNEPEQPEPGVLTDERIERAVNAALSALSATGRHAAWGVLTYCSGPYEVTKLCSFMFPVARAIEREVLATTRKLLDQEPLNASGETPTQHAHRWATELAVSMARKFYPEVPQFEPLPDLLGVITQIDNMVTGLQRKRAAEQNARIMEAVDSYAKEYSLADYGVAASPDAARAEVERLLGGEA